MGRASGSTSSPATCSAAGRTVFAKALADGDAYAEQIAASAGDAGSIFLALAMRDVTNACDLLRPIWERTETGGGYVSIEVDPNLADDVATIAQATHFHEAIARPNLLVKITATDAGVPAIEEMTARGYSINVTLIFSLARHRQVAEAYLRGLARLVASGGKPSRVHSVASFFVSRVDTEADRRLAEAGRKDLKGRLAIANANAYQQYKQLFLRRALGRARRARREPAALPLGVDLGQGPEPARHALRRGADRAGDDLDHARGDDPRLLAKRSSSPPSTSC